MAIFITGGARSGKSSFAEQLAAYRNKRGIYLATSEALDDEMTERIKKHQLDRQKSGFQWQTIEEPLHIVSCLQRLKAVAGSDMEDTVVLVDCLTLWLSNWFFKLDVLQNGNEGLHEQFQRLADEVAQYPYPLILVSNEVGDGIVPADALSRSYRDEAGRLNALIAEQCQQAFLVTAGIPIELKSIAYTLEDE